MSADFHYPAHRRSSKAPANTPPSLLRPSFQRAAPIARPAPDTSVVTMLTPHERTRVDAAGEGCYVAVHRDTVDEVIAELRQCRAQAVIVSVLRCDARAASSVARLVREFPSVPAVALLSETTADSAHAVLALGQYGVQSLVDVRDAAGWRTLRQLFSTHRGGSIERRATALLASALSQAPEDCRRFLEACFNSPARVGTIRQLSKRLGVRSNTLMSRFYRAQLPAPKRYLAFARLARAATMFENPGLSITQVSNALEYSSPQSFGRHIHTMLGVSAVAFRREFTGDDMLQRFITELVTPYRDVLQAFHPLVVIPTWSRVVSRVAERVHDGVSGAQRVHDGASGAQRVHHGASGDARILSASSDGSLP